MFKQETTVFNPSKKNHVTDSIKVSIKEVNIKMFNEVN